MKSCLHSLWILLLLVGAVYAQATPAGAPAAKTPDHTQRLRATYREGFQPPAGEDAEAQRMRKLIEKINTMALPSQQPTPKTNKPAPVSTPKTKPQPKPVAAPKAPEILSGQTLKELRTRMPESVADPIQLGDALFHGGHKAEALRVYQSVLENTTDAQDRGWLLYQMGCCLIETKPTEAKTYFRQVRKELPQTHWGQLAAIQLDLVEWTDRNQPTQFLEDLHRDLQQKNERIETPQASQPRTGGQTKQTGSGLPGPQAKADPTPAK